jgi:hypothetical protein
MIVQSPNSGAAIFSLQSETADWIKQRKAIVVLKLIDKIGLDPDTDMQNEITEEIMGDVLIFMELTKQALNHMHGVFEQIFMPLLHNE